jgi:hypothetical protein
MHTIWVDYAIPVEISLAGAGSITCEATVIPASKPLFDSSEFVRSVAKQVAVRETAKAICHWLSDCWVWLMHTGFSDWVSHAISWLCAAISWLLALFSDHN